MTILDIVIAILVAEAIVEGVKLLLKSVRRRHDRQYAKLAREVFGEDTGRMAGTGAVKAYRPSV